MLKWTVLFMLPHKTKLIDYLILCPVKNELQECPLSHPHSKHREKVLLKVLKYKTFPFFHGLSVSVSQLVMVFCYVAS